MRALLSLALLAACSSPRVPARAGASSYAVTVGPELVVDAHLPGGPLRLEDGAERFLRDVEIEDGARWRPLARLECERACHVRYRFLLREAAATFDDVDVAIAYGDAFQAPPSTWLLHGASGSFRVRFDRDVVSGLAPRDGARVGTSLEESPFTALGAWRVRRKGALEIAIAPVRFAMDDDAIERWITEAAGAVTRFYGRAPAPHLAVLVTPGRGAEVDGKTLGGGGASVSMRLGTEAVEADARRSWVLVHELVHVASPSIGAPHRWMEEGLATYLEPIIRVRAGLTTEDAMWRDLIREAPKGQVGTLEEWGPMYWGGAISYLRADIELRQRGRSLGEVLRGLDGVAVRWTASRFLAAVPTLRPDRVSLEALWKSLGVSLQGDAVHYDDAAPLAAIRKEIVR